MGELLHAVGRPLLRLAVVAALAAGCGPVTPTGPAPTAPAGPSASDGVPASPGAQAIDPGVGRLVWLVDRAGDLGVWTTDLAGGDARAYLANVDAAVTGLRDALRVGDDVVLIRETPTASSAELWLLPANGGPPRVLLDHVESFIVSGEHEVLAVRDEGTSRAVWRVATADAAPSVIAKVPLPTDGPDLGPFGFAISPDGRTVAMGWVGGPLEVVGPNPQSLDDFGAPLVVNDDGRVVAVTGRAGEAYTVDGDRLNDLAPQDSDPVGMPGTGIAAWPVLADDGALDEVEVRDLIEGTGRTYRAHGVTSNISELTLDFVILEATAFDPLHRTVGVVDRRDGRFATFEAAAPEG